MQHFVQTFQEVGAEFIGMPRAGPSPAASSDTPQAQQLTTALEAEQTALKARLQTVQQLLKVQRATPIGDPSGHLAEMARMGTPGGHQNLETLRAGAWVLGGTSAQAVQVRATMATQALRGAQVHPLQDAPAAQQPQLQQQQQQQALDSFESVPDSEVRAVLQSVPIEA